MNIQYSKAGRVSESQITFLKSLLLILVVLPSYISAQDLRNHTGDPGAGSKGGVQLADNEINEVDGVLCGLLRDRWLPGKLSRSGLFMSYKALMKFYRRQAERGGNEQVLFAKWESARTKHRQGISICRGEDSTDNQDDSQSGGESGGGSAPQADGRYILVEENPNFPSSSNGLFTKAVRAYINDKNVLTIGVAQNRSLEHGLHAAHIGLELLDNNEDGICDNQAVCDRLAETSPRGAVLYFAESQMQSFEGWSNTQSLFVQDVQMNSAIYGGSTQRFDATIEEVFHWLTDNGWSKVYPSVFGITNSSSWGQYVNQSIASGFYDPTQTGDTEIDDIRTTVTESMYWVVTSRMGAQNYAWRIEEIQAEWRSYNRNLLLQNVPGMLALIEDPQYGFPQNLPDGEYAPAIASGQ